MTTRIGSNPRKGFDKSEWNKSDEAKQSRRKYRHDKSKWTSNVKYLSKPITAIDGEGINNDDGTHSYIMLAISNVRPLIANHALATGTILEYLHNNLSPDHINVIYGGSYDFNCWIADLDEEQVRKLYNSTYVSEGLYYEGFTLRWIKGKNFSISRDGKTVVINDVISFYQTAFIQACDSYLGSYKGRGELVREKAKRGTFSYNEVAAISHYNQLELDLLVAIATELRNRLNKVNLRPRRWDGPGAIAASLFLREHVREHMAEGPDAVETAARYAYAGGHFELVKYGYVKGPAYEYDLNSAYPAALRQVPSLAGGTWNHYQSGKREAVPYGLYRVRYTGSNPAIPAPIFCRAKNGTVSYPLNTVTWVWSPEYEALQEYCAAIPGAKYVLLECWEFTPANDHKPFGFINKLYDERRKLKAAGDGAHVAIKLALNSMYGKLAQQTGWVPAANGRSQKIPRYHELKWAGFATSWCRAQVMRAAISNPSAIIAFETDAVFSSEPLDVRTGDSLGDWEVTIFESLTYVQSGHYYATTVGGKEVVKCRGIDRGFISRETVENRLTLPENQRTLKAQLTRFYGAGIALARGLDEYWRKWRTEPKMLQLMPSGKRIHGGCDCDPDRLEPNRWHATYCPITGGLSHEFPIAWINPDPDMSELAELRETEKEFEFD
jgi:hypothetical protein